MDYSAWPQPPTQPQPPQNPNPSVDPTHWQTADYSAVAYHSFNVDPYQYPSIYPPGTYYQPQPQPQPQSQPQVVAGIDPTYVAPNAAVAYGEQTVSYGSQHGAIAAYYPDPNAAWGASVSLIGTTPSAAGFSMPNPTTQPERKNAKKKGNKKTKTKITTKTKVVQSAWCDVCRVDCNSKDVLDQHNLGKKHKKNLEKLKLAAAVPGPSFIAPPIAAFATTQVVTATVSSQAIVTAPAAATALPHAMTAGPPAAIAGFPAVAASLPALSTAPRSLPIPASVPIKPIIGPQENPDKPQTSSSKKARKKAAARTDNLETKRRKVLEGGAAANSVRACSICNVVCNSDTVFNYHLAGQKHASMVRKYTSRTGLASAM